MASLRDAVYGLAVGDALGVPVEFKNRGGYHIDGMTGGGSYGKPVINRLYVNRKPEQYKETNNKKDELIFYMLVASELGQDTSILWEQIFELDN